MAGAMAAIRPSRIDTSPLTISSRSFIVTIVPPRMSSDMTSVASGFSRTVTRSAYQPSRVALRLGLAIAPE